MLEAEYEKEREKIEGKEDDRLKEERIQTTPDNFSAGLALSGAGDAGGDYLRICSEKDSDASNARTKGELQEISKPPKPVYNGNVFTTGKYDTEEEELLVWSLTCLQAPLNNQAYERYKELFCRLLPEKAKILFPEMNENNQAKVA